MFMVMGVARGSNTVNCDEYSLWDAMQEKQQTRHPRASWVNSKGAVLTHKMSKQPETHEKT